MTITLTREEAQQVLDALECMNEGALNAEIKLLRDRLAQPEPAASWEPQVERQYSPEGVLLSEKIKHTPESHWRGLTATERKVLWLTSNNPAEFGELLEARLREKNERDA